MAAEVQVFNNGDAVMCRGRAATVKAGNAPNAWYPEAGETVDIQFDGVAYNDPKHPRYYTAHYSELQAVTS